MEITPDIIADLTTLIFAAALDPARWHEFLARLHGLSGGARTHIFGRDMATGRLFGFMGAGYDDRHMRDYGAHFRHLNPWVSGFAGLPAGAYMPVAAMYPRDALFRTEFYNDWVRPQGDIYGGGGAMLFNDHDRFLAFGGHVPAGLIGKVEEDFARLVRMLTPHVRQAFEINRAMEGKAVADFLVGGGGDESGRAATAIVLLDRHGRVLFANPAAETHISQGAALRVGALGRLASPDPAIAGFLERALLALAAPGGAPSAQLTTDLPGAGHALVLRAARFCPDRQARSPFGVLYSGDDRALLMTIEQGPPGRKRVARLLSAQGLSPAEIDVALALAAGRQVSEIAMERQASINTVRNQRHAALSKLGLHRQGQLARFIADLENP